MIWGAQSYVLPFSLDLSGKLCWNEHFSVDNILKFPKISLTSKDIWKILQKNIILGPKLKMRLKYFKFQNEA